MDNECTKKEEDKKVRLTILLHLATEISTEIRSRREPELIYTGAAIGTLGAINWAVASLVPSILESKENLPFYSHPAFFGGVLCLIIGVLVCYKIRNENTNYYELRKKQISIYKTLTCNYSIEQVDLPDGFKVAHKLKADRFKDSLYIVGSTTFFSIAFLIVIYSIL